MKVGTHLEVHALPKAVYEDAHFLCAANCKDRHQNLTPVSYRVMDDVKELALPCPPGAVSYTHLTLPTKA